MGKKVVNKIKSGLKTEVKWWMKFRTFFADYRRMEKDSFVIFCIPEHGNIGDQAIALAERKFLKDLDPTKEILEAPAFIMRRHRKLIAKLIGNRTILIHGGGFIGTLWINEERVARSVIQTFPNNKIIFFPQTLYYEKSAWGEKEKKISREIFDSHSNLWLCAREKRSYELAKRLFKNVHIELVPDMVLYLNQISYEMTRSGALLCFRHDHEKLLPDQDKKILVQLLNKYLDGEDISETDTVIEEKIFRPQRKKEVLKKVRQFAQSRIIITDRLHGMVLAAIAGTPCIAFGNCSKKVQGIYEWIKHNEFIVCLESTDNIEAEIARLLSLKHNQYDNMELKQNFKSLEQMIKE